MRYACYSQARSPLHRADDRTAWGCDSAKNLGASQAESRVAGKELQQGCSLCQSASWDIQLWAFSRWKRLRKQGHTLPLHLGSRTRGGVLWFCSWKQRSGKLAWTPACMGPWALSITFCLCYANLKQLVLLLVSWALCSLINFKRDRKRMAMNICFWLSD